MAIEILSLLVAGAGASYGWWIMQRRREASIGLRELEAAFDENAAVVFSVAKHELVSRKHEALSTLHLLYGLLQDETFTDAITAVGGVPDAIETRVLAKLDEAPEGAAVDDAIHVINRSYGISHHNGRKISVADLWLGLWATDGAALVDVDHADLAFQLVHGMKPPDATGPDVHVVLRNDDYTTQDFVTWILRDVFELSETDAHARMLETHTNGKAVVGRYKISVARDKLISVRSRAREQHFPLWIGVEDC